MRKKTKKRKYFPGFDLIKRDGHYVMQHKNSGFEYEIWDGRIFYYLKRNKNWILRTLTHFREGRRELSKKSKRYWKTDVSLVEGVHTKANTFVDLLRQNNNVNRTPSPYPNSKQNYIALEFEFASNEYPEYEDEDYNRNSTEYLAEQIIQDLKDNDLYKYCADHDEHIGWEIKAMVPENRLDIMQDILNTILYYEDEMQFDGCGMHVHIDMRNRDPEKCFNNLIRFQPLLTKLVADKRLDENYCKIYNEPEMSIAEETEERYQAINPMSYDKHKTIEVRLHEGCDDVDRIMNWLKLLIKIVDSPMLFMPVGNKTLKDCVKASRHLKLTKQETKEYLNIARYL